MWLNTYCRRRADSDVGGLQAPSLRRASVCLVLSTRWLSIHPPIAIHRVSLSKSSPFGCSATPDAMSAQATRTHLWLGAAGAEDTTLSAALAIWIVKPSYASIVGSF